MIESERRWPKPSAPNVNDTVSRLNRDGLVSGIIRTALATKLSDRPVLSADSETLGNVHDVAMNPGRGELVSVVVDLRRSRRARTGQRGARPRPRLAYKEGLDDSLVIDPGPEAIEEAF